MTQTRIIGVRLCTALMTMLLCIMLSSCDLFSTRTPDPPDLDNTFIWTPASDPNTLLQNFKGTLEVLDAVNHTRCFLGANDVLVSGDSKLYSFTPRTGIDGTTQSIFVGWTVGSEENYLVKLRAVLPQNPRLTVLFTNLQINQESGQSAQLSADYVITLPTSSNSSVPSTIAGSFLMHAELITTEQATKEWRIVSWIDYAPKDVVSPKTFTDIKAQFSL